jgi:hypothetical protein
MNQIKAFIRVNRLDSGCSIGVIVICLISTAFIYWLNHGGRYSGLDKQNADHVVLIFSLALKENDSRKVHSVVAREKWPEIDEWIMNHKQVDCDLDFDGENGGFAGGADFENNGQAQGDMNIFITCGPIYYSLDIVNIELEYIDEEWKIVNWGDICESTSLENTCEDFFD